MSRLTEETVALTPRLAPIDTELSIARDGCARTRRLNAQANDRARPSETEGRRKGTGPTLLPGVEPEEPSLRSFVVEAQNDLLLGKH